MDIMEAAKLLGIAMEDLQVGFKDKKHVDPVAANATEPGYDNLEQGLEIEYGVLDNTENVVDMDTNHDGDEISEELPETTNQEVYTPDIKTELDEKIFSDELNIEPEKLVIDNHEIESDKKKKIRKELKIILASKDGKVTCSECDKILAKSALGKHMRIHQADKWFSCEVCDKTFVHRTMFERHQIIHTGTKQFACTNCGKACNRMDNLKRHLKSCKKMEQKEGTQD